LKISTSGLRITLALTGVLSAALIAAAAPAGAQPVGLPIGSTCAVAPDSGLSFASARGMAREPATARTMAEVPAASKLANHSRFSANVPVYIHVITNHRWGLVGDQTINQQMRVLKKAYEGGYGGVNTGLHFRLAGVDHTDNPEWFFAGPGSPAERQMKKALRVGGSDTLNVYTTAMPPHSGLLGWATFPSDYRAHPDQDGIVLNFRSMPGGKFGTAFSLGQTLTHEAGHWFGLYHTFQGGCGPIGDAVEDTPAEATPTSGCPTDKDTCPKPGMDPVHNYMDYSYDSCYTEFTAGQRDRMQDQFDYFRATA
jgi:hypothetical protein